MFNGSVEIHTQKRVERFSSEFRHGPGPLIVSRSRQRGRAARISGRYHSRNPRELGGGALVGLPRD